MNVEVTAFSENEVVIEISQDKINKEEHIAGDNDIEANITESLVGVASSQQCANTRTEIYQNAEAVSQMRDDNRVPQKYRSVSESSGDESVSIRDGKSCL